MSRKDTPSKKRARVNTDKLLATLIDRAGALRIAASTAKKAYDEARAQLEPLLFAEKGADVLVLGEKHTAILEHEHFHAIDAEALYKDEACDSAVFFSIAEVPLGRAKAVLTKTLYDRHCQEHTKRDTTLKIGDRKKTLAETTEQKPAVA
jgi:hypothetical protein